MANTPVFKTGKTGSEPGGGTKPIATEKNWGSMVALGVQTHCAQGSIPSSSIDYVAIG